MVAIPASRTLGGGLFVVLIDESAEGIYSSITDICFTLRFTSETGEPVMCDVFTKSKCYKRIMDPEHSP